MQVNNKTLLMCWVVWEVFFLVHQLRRWRVTGHLTNHKTAPPLVYSHKISDSHSPKVGKDQPDAHQIELTTPWGVGPYVVWSLVRSEGVLLVVHSTEIISGYPK